MNTRLSGSQSQSGHFTKQKNLWPLQPNPPVQIILTKVSYIEEFK
jgi:hypothetical protein